MKRVNSESNTKQGLSIAESCASSTTVNTTTNNTAPIADEITKVIRIEFEHDGRMTAEDAREYAAGIVISAIHGQMHGKENGIELRYITDQGEPEPQKRPTFYEAAREFIEMHYNHSTDRDQIAAFMAEDISRAAADVFGKGPAAYLLDVIANRVQSWCNPALSDEDNE